ncbi:unnamed protein product, partial [Heterotrigona itama]
PERLVKNTTTKIERVRGRQASPTTGGEPEEEQAAAPSEENPVCPCRAGINSGMTGINKEELYRWRRIDNVSRQISLVNRGSPWTSG